MEKNVHTKLKESAYFLSATSVLNTPQMHIIFNWPNQNKNQTNMLMHNRFLFFFNLRQMTIKNSYL